jgi:hypothetical protein
MQVKKVLLMICSAVILIQTASAEPTQKTANNISTVNHAFAPGEKLTYDISWSNILRAGIAVMDVKEGRMIEGRRTYQFASTTHSVGMVHAFYPVQDTVVSEVDAEHTSSLSFSLKESHGKRKREREMTFDHEANKVKVIVNKGTPEIYPVPEGVLDALSSLYYLRTRQDFSKEKPIIMDVHDSGKTWAVEIQTLGKEKISTPAGEFNTIKVKTYPKYEGVFMHKGEIFIWLTDDTRKIPVLMKSTISIGSIVATLTGIQTGQDKP